MELIVLGAGPAYTDRPGASGAAYLLRSGGTSILLDLGQGSFTRLAAELEPSRLDGVLISHLHPDHFVDLVPLRHYLRFEFTPVRRVRVLGPAGLADRLDALNGNEGFTAASLDCEAFDGGPVPLGDLLVRPTLVTHTDESYGFRVEGPDGGPGLVYSGDCGRAADLAGVIQPGDVLLAEVSFGPGPVPEGALHLDGPAVGDLAAGSRAGRVLLTHLQMGYDEAATIESVRRRFDGPVTLVEPGERAEI
ncbi:MAG TPA: MBL fold metallo-hydrolase [Candidatus Limnocylindrales bacterium]|nr:MBL fold metallo-hydrolase [Candidatus Limnocylindrales bacterium]